MIAPYDCEKNPLLYYSYLHGRADHRAGRPARQRALMSPTAARAYHHGYNGHKWRRLPCGQLVWEERRGHDPIPSRNWDRVPSPPKPGHTTNQEALPIRLVAGREAAG